MGWFSFQRYQGFPTHYPSQHTPAHVDVLTAGLCCAFLILGFSVLCLLPSYTGKKRWNFLIQVVTIFFIGGVVILGNFGSSWEVGHVSIRSPYKAGNPGEINGVLGIHIALRGINITLNGHEVVHEGMKKKNFGSNELIDYNENFSWEWAQGRFGFGYYAGRFSREYREAVYSGIPIPILQVAEYFTFDGEGIRFGRHYKFAGWYSHIMMWTAFPCWILSTLLFYVVVRYGSLFLIGTGIFQLAAIGIWFFIRNWVELHVPFESSDGEGEVVLKTKFGPDFYLVFINSLLCLGLGFGIFGLNAIWPDELCDFFGIDPLTLYDSIQLTQAEIQKEKQNKVPIRGTVADEDEDTHNNASSDEEASILEMDSGSVGRRSFGSELVLKRRVGVESKLFQKSFRIKPTVPKRLIHPPQPSALTEENEMEPLRRPLLPQQLRSPHQNLYTDSIDDYENFPPPPAF